MQRKLFNIFIYYYSFYFIIKLIKHFQNGLITIFHIMNFYQFQLVTNFIAFAETNNIDFGCLI